MPMTVVPVSRPIVRCVPRETSGASAGALESRARCCSKSIACWTCGSPTTYATTTASSPAASPASMPLMSRGRTTVGLVAGEAEQGPAVVHELVDVAAGDHRCRALLGSDEVDQDQCDDPREDRVGQQLARRGDGCGSGAGSTFGDGFGHGASSSGSRVPSWVRAYGGEVSGFQEDRPPD